LSRSKMISVASGSAATRKSEKKGKKGKKEKKQKEKKEKKRQKREERETDIPKSDSFQRKPVKKKHRSKEEREQDLLEWVKQQTDYVPTHLPPTTLTPLKPTPEQAESIALFRKITEAELRHRNK
jgi:hypothetical protein